MEKIQGLGLSGAEGARDNALFVDYLQTHHGDIADHVFLTSDSVATVAAAFEHGMRIQNLIFPFAVKMKSCTT